jgi:hypothetical protein
MDGDCRFWFDAGAATVGGAQNQQTHFFLLPQTQRFRDWANPQFRAYGARFPRSTREQKSSAAKEFIYARGKQYEEISSICLHGGKPFSSTALHGSWGRVEFEVALERFPFLHFEKYFNFLLDEKSVFA